MVQEIGETREEMTRGLMKRIESAINDTNLDKFWILVHAKPFSGNLKIIKQKIILIDREPPMLLACLCFEVDKKAGVLKLLWALPGDWPTYTLSGTVKPIPEVIASYDKLERKINYDIKQFAEHDMGPALNNSDIPSIYTAI